MKIPDYTHFEYLHSTKNAAMGVNVQAKPNMGESVSPSLSAPKPCLVSQKGRAPFICAPEVH
jgi:hypothetical protein